MEDLCIFYWTDSTIALYWMRDTKKKWKIFVSNRVAEIRKYSKVSLWRHCPGLQNIADIVSRGIDLKKLVNLDTWWAGPTWLRQNHDNDWPIEPIGPFSEEHLKTLSENELVRKPKTVAVVTRRVSFVDMTRYSKFKLLLKVVARCFRFIRHARNRTCRQNCKDSSKRGLITASEISRAEEYCIRSVQIESFREQIKDLKKVTNSHIEYKNVRIFDDNGILKVKSRIRLNPDMNENLILLPSDHPFTELLILDCHKVLHHAGVRDIMAKLREKYWIIRMRQTIKRVISPCAICSRWRAKHYNVEVAPLPKERVCPSRVFSVVGIDFLGAIHLYDSDESTKAYILIFSCATTRAIHIELVSSMSVHHFLLALKRFIGRRGVPKIIISDNFFSFKKANSDLVKAFKTNLQSDEFSIFIADKGIDWKFIVQYAPFWGGFYERMVRSVKTPLKKVLRNAKVDTEEMRTILVEIEMILNNRPLTYIYNSPDEFSPLTPSHFLVGSRLDTIPSVYGQSVGKNDLVDRYNMLEDLKNTFWEQWANEYLPELINFAQSRKTNIKDIELGDIVLVENDKKRGSWKLGRVVKLIKGKEEKVRAAEVKTENKTLVKRPVQKLYPLEIGNSDVDTLDAPVRNSAPVPTRSAQSVPPSRESLHAASSDASVFEDAVLGSDVAVKHSRRGRDVRLPSRYKDDYVFDV